MKHRASKTRPSWPSAIHGFRDLLTTFAVAWTVLSSIPGRYKILYVALWLLLVRPFCWISKLTRKIPGNAFGQRWSIGGRMVLSRTDGAIYLRRLRLIQTPMFGVLLHHIEAEDEPGPMHDHPWALTKRSSFASFVVSGGYNETIGNVRNDWDSGKAVMVNLTNDSFHSAGHLHFFPADGVHRISKVLPNTRTLVLVGRRKDSWHFYEPGVGLVPWREHLETYQGRDPLGTRLDSSAPMEATS